MAYVVCGLGSNKAFLKDGVLLEPPDILEQACEKLSEILSELKVSSVYTTKPMYVENQPSFFNMAAAGFYDGDAFELLKKTQAIESLFGRNRAFEIRNGPRTLDIDIEIFGNETFNTAELELPHPRLKERAFILIPLLEIYEENADIPERRMFEGYLSKLPEQGVELYGRIGSQRK